MSYKRQTDKKLALELGIQTYQILPNDDEVCIPSLSSIFLAVKHMKRIENENSTSKRISPHFAS